jgi:hypothetical protein
MAIAAIARGQPSIAMQLLDGRRGRFRFEAAAMNPRPRAGFALSLSEALIAPQVGRNDVLERLFGQVKWYRFEKLLARLKPESAGRPPFDPLVMFKALLLQQWYRLSDAELEEALNDRLSFRRFLNFRWRMPHPITPRFAVSVTGWSKRS